MLIYCCSDHVCIDVEFVTVAIMLHLALHFCICVHTQHIIKIKQMELRRRLPKGTLVVATTDYDGQREDVSLPTLPLYNVLLSDLSEL